MTDTIRLYYHAGYFNKRNPVEIALNLLRYRNIHTPVYNVGDQLSPFIVEALSGRPVKHTHPFSSKKLLAIGSILAGIKPGDTAWGTGLMKPEHVNCVIGKPDISIKAVRGPETYKTLVAAGIDCPNVFGDPALLMPKLFMPKVEKKYSLGVIPHISQFDNFLSQMQNDEGAVLISPRENWNTFISKVLQCDRIVSSSLHGIILADAYGIPAVPVKFGEFLHGTPFKFLDYYRSTNREPVFLDHKDVFKGHIWTSYWESIGHADIDLKPLINAFPYKIPDQVSANL